MLSKEEIEKIKRGLTEELGRTITANECGLSTNDFLESIEILESALKYIEKLETREQKLIEKLEEYKKALKQDGIYGYDIEINEILKILKGENYE